MIFIETNAADSIFDTVTASFRTAWFGGNVPPGFTIGSYGGSGIGLGQTGDAVNIYNAAGALQASVTFGAATAGFSFDNAAGLTGAINQLSIAGTNGAFTSPAGEIGSPGRITAVPEPSTILLMGTCIGLGATYRWRRREK